MFYDGSGEPRASGAGHVLMNIPKKPLERKPGAKTCSAAAEINCTKTCFVWF